MSPLLHTERYQVTSPVAPRRQQPWLQSTDPHQQPLHHWSLPHQPLHRQPLHHHPTRLKSQLNARFSISDLSPTISSISYTARKSGSDGCMQFFIGCGHPIQTRACATEWIADQFKLGGQTPGPLSLNGSAIHSVVRAQVWIGWPHPIKTWMQPSKPTFLAVLPLPHWLLNHPLQQRACEAHLSLGVQSAHLLHKGIWLRTHQSLFCLWPYPYNRVINICTSHARSLHLLKMCSSHLYGCQRTTSQRPTYFKAKFNEALESWSTWHLWIEHPT
jgi:hypothetical protein